MSNRLQEKVVIVTGAAQGIGFGCARLLAAEGAAVVLVDIGSICGIQSLPNLVAYGAAKGGLLSLTRTLAGALSDDRIRVNYVIPGWVLTEGELAIQRAQGHGEELLRKEGEKLRFGRQQKPLDAAYAVVYLLSDESSQVTGTIFHIDAGESTLPIARGMYPG